MPENFSLFDTQEFGIFLELILIYFEFSASDLTMWLILGIQEWSFRNPTCITYALFQFPLVAIERPLLIRRIVAASPAIIATFFLPP